MPPPAPLDFDVTKRPNAKSRYEQEKIDQLVRCVEDPLYFCRQFVRIQHPTKGALPFEPYPYQERMIEAFHKNRFTVALTARQLGKALALNTPIPTPTGWTTMGEVKVGDHVLGDDGRPTTVTFVTDPMYGHECYEVEFDNGEVIVADAEHLWTVGSTMFRDGESRTLTTSDLIGWLERGRRQGQGVYITATQPVATPEAELPIPPYTLGVWLGDGNSGDGRFCGHKDDCLEMREHVMSDGFSLSEIKADRRNNVRFQTVYGLRGGLVKAGVFGNKHIPAEYLRASVDQRLALLQGLLDTDGYADRSGGVEFYQKDRRFAEQVFELVASLGMKPRLRPKIVNGDTYWRVRFATTRFTLFKLARKQAIADTTKGHPKNGRYFFKAIHRTTSVPVKCIQVDNDTHLFLAGRSMIPTHNTTCAAAYLLWRAMFVPDTGILITANKYVQALEIMDRIRYAYENLPDYIRAGAVEYNKGTIVFDNGSRITSRATSSDAGRGLSISLLYCDEFAFVPPNKASEFWTSIQPVLSTGGSCIVTSTPKSDEDEFAKIYNGAVDRTDEYGNPRPDGLGKNGWFALTIPWWEHPERDETWAKPFRDTLGENRFMQEFECRFITDDPTLVDPKMLSKMKGKRPEFFTNTVRWYEAPKANTGYLVALDPSLGTGGDDAAIQVFSLPEMIQVAEWQHNRTVPRQQVRTLLQVLLFIDTVLRDDPNHHGEPEIYWTVENNTIGEAILQIIEDTGEERFPGMMVNEKKRKGQTRRFRKGMTTDNRRKLSACARAKSLVESGRMKINSENLIRELKTFVQKDVTFSAKPGCHDDLVSAMLLTVRMLDVVIGWGATIGDLREHIADGELYEDTDAPMPVVV